MKLSEAWLREWVDPPVTTGALARQLTMAGLEVDRIEPVAPAFSGVVVGEVRAVEPHPAAERLTLCRVDDGAETRQVVCGAPNVRAGMLAALARPGAQLPGGVEIESTQLRGEASAGMLLSAAELGLGEEAGGILELDPGPAPGTDLRAALALEDHVIELDLTPNRGDCLSLRGIARELAVLNRLETTPPPCEAVAATREDRFPVTLEDPSGCPRYLGRVIRGVDLRRAAPLWMRERLRRSGLRSIDPVVDVTNYVLLELGQPLHAFDLAELTEAVVVRRARAGERLELLDGASVELDAETLLIADAHGPLAMAGVMGGARSGIGRRTRDVFLECAFFAPAVMAGTARRYGLQTDAAQRFERGVDYELQWAAIERATALLLAITGGEAGPVSEARSAAHLPEPPQVPLRGSRLERLTGLRLDARAIGDVLARLGMDLLEAPQQDAQAPAWLVRPPSHRFDIAIEEDLIEEICRIHGYGEIPARAPLARLDLRRVPAERRPRHRIKALLADLGYQEAITYSFVDPELEASLGAGHQGVALANPMSREQSVMRTTLLPGLLHALIANQHRQQPRVRLFELGRCFRDGETLEQPWMLGGVVQGLRLPESWSHRAERVDFFDVKGDVEMLLALSGDEGFELEPADDAALHPGQAARLLRDGAVIGRLGRLHPQLEERLGASAPVHVFELEAAAVERRRQPAHRELSRYPSVRRDLSLRVGADTSAAALERVLRATLGATLTDFKLFDVYYGESLDFNEKSVAVGLTFQDPSRTLTDADINQLVDSALRALETKLGARMR